MPGPGEWPSQQMACTASLWEQQVGLCALEVACVAAAELLVDGKRCRRAMCFGSAYTHVCCAKSVQLPTPVATTV